MPMRVASSSASSTALGKCKEAPLFADHLEHGDVRNPDGIPDRSERVAGAVSLEDRGIADGDRPVDGLGRLAELLRLGRVHERNGST